MAARSLFISDLHLTPERPAITRAFQRFLEQDAPTATTLYILGDFFEYWIGDDVMDDFHRQIAHSLQQLSGKGVDIYLMPGNRDFLIGNSFCQQADCTLLADPTLIQLDNKPVLLMHGDSLCTSDVSYMRFRKVVRNPIIQKLALSLPSCWRRNLAENLREKSRNAGSSKPMSIMDVTPSAVDQIMAKFGVKTLIHGHTHKANTHPLPDSRQRIVLGDWDAKGWQLRHDESGFQLQSFPITEP